MPKELEHSRNGDPQLVGLAAVTVRTDEQQAVLVGQIGRQITLQHSSYAAFDRDVRRYVQNRGGHVGSVGSLGRESVSAANGI